MNPVSKTMLWAGIWGIVSLCIVRASVLAQEQADDPVSGRDVMVIETQIGPDQAVPSEEMTIKEAEGKIASGAIAFGNRVTRNDTSPVSLRGAIATKQSMDDGKVASLRSQRHKGVIARQAAAGAGANKAILNEEIDSGLSPRLSEEDIVQLNSSLRSVIRDHQQMQERNDNLLKEMRRQRGQITFDSARINRLTTERDEYIRQNEKIVELNEGVQKRLQNLVSQVRKRKADYEQRIVELQRELQKTKEQPKAAEATGDQVQDAGGEAGYRKDASTAEKILQDQQEGAAVIAMIEEISVQNEELKRDEARIHYNMGNVYFHQGDYQKAAAEYRKAVKLMPADANAHFNLAFVTGEYIRDFQTALEHYQQYLYLNPGAEDVKLVREKILEAELNLRGAIDSGLEKDWHEYKREQRVH